MLHTSLNFKIHVPDFDPASCRLESTVLFFRNNTTVLLFLYLRRTVQQLLYKRSRFRKHSSVLLAELCNYIFLQVHLQWLMVALKVKAAMKIRMQWKTYNWRTIQEACTAKNLF